MSLESESTLLNVRETARLLGVHENTVRNWAAKGTLRSSRVAGSTAHRFEREEVQRLLKARGQQVSPVGPMLRVDGPELIGAVELDRWAATDDAKGAFPELMSRLLASTPGLTNVDARSHEGVSAPGWDGEATSRGSRFLPAGELRFEFGTDQKIKAKAQSDWDKRVAALPRDAGTTFVFATPRNWPTGKSWAKERESERKFLGVKVIDAHVLSDWLRATPAVHYWISERLGYRPSDAKTIEGWRREFDDRISVALSAAFFLAGRSAESQRLRELQTNAGKDAIIVRAPSREEAIAFLHAVMARDLDLLHRTVIVHSGAAWDRLVMAQTELVLVPHFDAPNLRSAAENGHRVILAIGVNERAARVDIDIPKIHPHEAGIAIQEANPETQEPHRIVSLARRSLPALLRSLARDPRLQEPPWVKDQTQSDVLSRMLLAGVWTPRTADQELIARLAERPAHDIERLLQHLSTSGDSPFVYSGGVWLLAAPVEAGMLLCPKLTARDMQVWKKAVLEVLLEPDPYRGMDTIGRLTASANGASPGYSPGLRACLAQGMVLAASIDVPFPMGRTGQEWVNEIAREVLRAAEDDETGTIWERLTDVLPLIAEAAPEVFLDAIESDLARSSPYLKGLFKDSGFDVLGSSSPHTGILWALETLCWDAASFSRAGHALARLAELDPGGRLSNRPLESLRNVTLGWTRLSGAAANEKLALVADLLRSTPDVGWKTLLELWPNDHIVASSPRSPLYKDWVPSSKVTWSEWGRFVEGLLELALEHVGNLATRWQELVERADSQSLSPAHRGRVIHALETDANVEAWTAQERFSLWQSIRDMVDRHEVFPDEDWSLPDEELDMWRGLASAIEPESDPRRYLDLFNWRTHVGQLKHGDKGFEEELRRRQREAVAVVSKQGIDALKTLAKDVQAPEQLGDVLAEATDGALDRGVISWLETEAPNLRRVALAHASQRITKHGLNWVREAITWPEIQSEKAQADLMWAVPSRRKYWAVIATLGDDLEDAYWNRMNPYGVQFEEYEEAVRKLIEHGAPWSAINVLANALHEKAKPNVDLIKAAFGAIDSSAGPIADRTMTSYYVQTLLTYMEETAPDDPATASLEFQFFNLLHKHEPSRALYRSLGNSASQFVEFVNLVYRAEGQEKRELTADETAKVHLAFRVLRKWPTVPGQRPDGSIDGDHLNQWVRAARLAFADCGRTSIGDEVIGEVLSASPQGLDGIWPAEPVREVIESVGSARLDTGLHIGLTNRRGFTTRGAFDGGNQERELELKYRGMAANASSRWPRTARVLRGIADSYRQEARRFDADAEHLGDGG